MKDRAYKIEEIRDLFQFANLRIRAVILMLASTGIRIGALPGMKVGDPHLIQNFYKIYVYPRTIDKYFVY